MYILTLLSSTFYTKEPCYIQYLVTVQVQARPGGRIRSRMTGYKWVLMSAVPEVPCQSCRDPTPLARDSMYGSLRQPFSWGKKYSHLLTSLFYFCRAIGLAFEWLCCVFGAFTWYVNFESPTCSTTFMVCVLLIASVQWPFITELSAVSVSITTVWNDKMGENVTQNWLLSIKQKFITFKMVPPLLCLLWDSPF